MQKTNAPEFVPEAHPDDTAGEVTIDVAARRYQIFPVLSATDIDRLRRFGSCSRWRNGDVIFEAGRGSPGMVVVLSGHVAITRCDAMGHVAPVTVIGPGEFTAEVAQLSGRPALVNAHAAGDVEGLLIDSESLRSLVVAEAQLGERIMRALILRRVALRQVGSVGPVLVGSPENPALFRLQSVLASNGEPYTVCDPGADPGAAALAAKHAPLPDDWPLVVCPDGTVKKNPSLAEMGRCLGTLPDLRGAPVFDVLVVGAGPAGLTTAVYAASEGLSVLVVDQYAYGGQAGASARIENYLGFPTGISGRALAGRSYVQAQKFGAEIAIPAAAARLECEPQPLRLSLDDGTEVRARAVVLACGARYRRPDWKGLGLYEGRGIFYWASPIEAKLCRRDEAIVVGGGNSAGQAAVFLAAHASLLHIVIRSASLETSMSSYLVERIAATPNIVVHPHTEITQLDGDEHGLSRVQWRNRQDGTAEWRHMRWVFLFIGADPHTAWLAGCGVGVDSRGFIRTGEDVVPAECGASGHLRDRVAQRSSLQTSVPGVFAVGDVRAGSTKRVAAAVGDGAAVVAQIHAYLAPPARH
jgi:thioredoxin reductase (NADPH)